MPARAPRLLAVLGTLTLLGGCFSKPAVDGEDDTADSGDTEETGPPIEGNYRPDLFTGVAAEVSEVIPTVAHLRFGTTVDAQGSVEFRRVDGGDWVHVLAGGDVGAAHDAVLFGMKAEHEYEAVPFATVDGEDVYGDAVRFTTGAIPREVPSSEVTVPNTGAATGFMGVGVVAPDSWAAVYDGDGDLVWFYPSPYANTMVSRVLVRADGRGLIFNAFGNAGASATDAGILKVSWDGTDVEIIPADIPSHDYLELPDGTLIYIAADVRQYEGEDLRGDRLIEVAPDGTQTEIWTGWDWYDPADFDAVTAGTAFTHANVVKYDEATNQLWLSLRNASSIARIDRTSGELVDRILGIDQDYGIVSGTAMSAQHSFTILDDGFVIMDNRNDPEEISRVVQYRLDDDEKTVLQTWEYEAPGGFHLLGLGDAVRLPNGNTRIVWSSAGELSEVTPEGEIVWQLNLDVGAGYGYGSYWEDPQAWP